MQECTEQFPTDSAEVAAIEGYWNEIRITGGDTYDIPFDDEVGIRAVAGHPLFYLHPELLLFLEDRQAIRIEVMKLGQIERILAELSQQMKRTGTNVLPDEDVLAQSEDLLTV